MDIYNYYLNRDKYFTPKTPNAALNGLIKGMLPKESFISSCLFLISPFTSGSREVLTEEEEYKRIRELERILAKKDLDIDTESILMYNLNIMVEHKNPEIALFAAESINAIENRYNVKIYNYRTEIAKKNDPCTIIKLIDTFFRYGYINKDKKDIQQYYYRSALELFVKLPENKINIDFNINRIKMLLTLKQFDTARNLINSLDETKITETQKVKLLLELEFDARNFEEISKIIDNCITSDIPESHKSEFAKWRI